MASGALPRLSKDADPLKPHVPKMPAQLPCAVQRLRNLARGARQRVSIGVVALATMAGSAAFAEVDLPEADRAEPITISAEAANRWQQGAYEVWVLRGNCRIEQGKSSARSAQAVLWIDHAAATNRQHSKVIAYLEGDVTIEHGRSDGPATLSDQTWLGRFFTAGAVEVHVAAAAGKPDTLPEVYGRGQQRRHPPQADTIRRTQFTTAEQFPGTVFPGTVAPGTVGEGLPAGSRRIRVFQRSNTPVGAQWFPDPNSNQWIAVIDSGVNLIIDGLPEFGSIDVSADRLVIWTVGRQELDLRGEAFQEADIPLEVYMEGNIVFRQAERVIRAERMYYDVNQEKGTIIEAEILTPVPQYEGLLRLKADVIQQVAPNQYFAKDAFLTSSRMGEPGYRIQSGDIYFEDIQFPAFNPFTGQPVIDPETHEQVIQHKKLATSRNNFLFLGPVPVFYWPALATNLEEPTFYIRQAQVKSDSVFGTQIITTFNGYELLGIQNRPTGTDWDLSFDYLSERGLGLGTAFLYNRDHFFNMQGPTTGLIDVWGIEDRGLDNLGLGRRALVPEKDYRYRAFWQHRQQMAAGYQLSGEVGWISDRNFLEEYYENEWDELKDETTGLELKRSHDNVSWSVTADARMNDFFTQTEWLPRADHFWLGQPLLRDKLTWYEHSSAGFARYRVADGPTDPNDQPFNLLPWETTATGERLFTRQEIDWPVQLGPFKVVPYALGELGHWGQDVNGDDLQRAYCQTGVRASMPIWRVDPTVENGLLNLHGLAHKVVFDVDFSVADSNRDLDQLQLYDPLDDDSVEAFRRRFTGAPLLAPFDSRSYALRTGMAGWVTAPSPEIAGNLTTMRFGMRHRWQTKRGMPGNRHIIDWLVLDTNATLFPDDDRDNFGSALGLVDYNLRWHIGDRLTFVSEGIFDFFDQGQQLVSFGGFLNRPPRGSLYLGVRLLEGPIDSKIVSLSYGYQMSPKWISSFGMSVDLADDLNIGQRFAVTRIGESLLISAGFTVDAARDNFGVTFAIEPRFLPKARLGRLGGAQIPPAGAYGLE